MHLLTNLFLEQLTIPLPIAGEGPFLTTYKEHQIPPLITVGKLLTAASHVMQDSDSDEDLRLLLGPGSSLGGARPKASVKDKDEQLAIVKFPRKDD